MVNIDINDSGRWTSLFSYKSIFLDIDIEYGITHWTSADKYSLTIRDTKTGFILVDKYQEFTTLEECEEYLINYYNILENMVNYESQLY